MSSGKIENSNKLKAKSKYGIQLKAKRLKPKANTQYS